MALDLEIRDLQTADELEACLELQKETWGASFSELVPVTMLRLTQRIGGVAAGAFDDNGRLIGFVFGLPGVEDGRPVHWSDMLAVRAGIQNRGTGEALKRYQREVLLARGVTRVYWTFDPLESRNAYLNFARLGATSSEYRRDLYGDTASPLHAGIGTDRLIVTWDIGSDRVGRALGGAPPKEPGDHLRIEIPTAIQKLKADSPDQARDWRVRTRAAFEQAFGDGYVVTGFLRGDLTGTYVLERSALAS